MGYLIFAHMVVASKSSHSMIFEWRSNATFSYFLLVLDYLVGGQTDLFLCGVLEILGFCLLRRRGYVSKSVCGTYDRDHHH